MANAEWDAIKLGSKLAFQSRQAIQRGGFSPWILPLSMAVAKDIFLDPLTIIPIAGLIPMTFSLCITVYLFIFLWGKGKWKVRIVIFFLELVDIIPVVGMIPLSVAAVLYAWSQNKKLIDQAKQQLPVLEQTNAQMIYAYQRDQSLRTMQEEATQAEQADRRDGTLKLQVLRAPQEREEYNTRMEATLAGMERVRKLSAPSRTTATRMSPKMV